ncbi:pre-mRNA-splicing factor syf2-like [Rhopilema esculentum]|uniref:pre-mRNA-splicing factor syf2-like n=1 Tax=Rhopilema esculentum TaxID=499914 RepID=UPI0031D12F28|eukprot:gene17447-9051_t
MATEKVEKGLEERQTDDTESESDSDNEIANHDRKTATQKKKDYMNRLRELQLRRNAARKLNHEEMVEEDRRNKLPANWEARKRKAEWELADQEARKEAEERGEDYDQTKLLQQSAHELEMLERKKKKRKNPDQGFSDYAAAQLRQYQRLTRQHKPDLESYNKMKDTMGDNAFPTAHSLSHGGEGKVSEAAVDRMVEDLGKQIQKREKFHRRRQHFDEADIDYINERNKKFNEKAERYYGKYTEEIKQNLERGTAI